MPIETWEELLSQPDDDLQSRVVSFDWAGGKGIRIVLCAGLVYSDADAAGMSHFLGRLDEYVLDHKDATNFQLLGYWMAEEPEPEPLTMHDLVREIYEDHEVELTPRVAELLKRFAAHQTKLKADKIAGLEAQVKELKSNYDLLWDRNLEITRDLDAAMETPDRKERVLLERHNRDLEKSYRKYRDALASHYALLKAMCDELGLSLSGSLPDFPEAGAQAIIDLKQHITGLEKQISEANMVAGCFAQDCAEQYNEGSGSRWALEALANRLRKGEHIAAHKHGELDDLIKLHTDVAERTKPIHLP